MQWHSQCLHLHLSLELPEKAFEENHRNGGKQGVRVQVGGVKGMIGGCALTSRRHSGMTSWTSHLNVVAG